MSKTPEMIRRMNKRFKHSKRRFIHLAQTWLQRDRSDLDLDNRVVPDTDRHGIAIAAIVKDEEAYVEEWLAFHTHVGVRSFYIYDNGSTDSTLEIVSGPRWRNRVRVIPWNNFGRHIGMQSAAYNHAVANFGHRYRWMTFIDVDEFVFPKHGGDLNETLQAYSDVPGVSLPWHMYGPNGHDVRPTGLVIENYTERAPLPTHKSQVALLNFKTIVDPAEIRYVRTHFCEFWNRPKAMYNDEKKKFSRFDRLLPENATAGQLQLNHYYTRSMEEFERKLQKGRVSKGGQSRNHGAISIKTKILSVQTVKDTSAVRFAEPVKALLRRIEPEGI